MIEPPEHGERAPGIDAIPDRRRRGRAAYRNPHLIALLRGQWRRPAAAEPENTAADAEVYEEPDIDEPDDLAAARGIAVSVLISLGMILAVTALVLLV
jgi:hypothetical protein